MVCIILILFISYVLTCYFIKRIFRFYTLLVISTALFQKPPYKNLIVNGLILATDGQKMSKSKKNYPDPSEVDKL